MQIEKIQTDLQEKISRSKDLEEKLAQALDLAHDRDLRHAEMLAKFELLMTQHEQTTTIRVQHESGTNEQLLEKQKTLNVSTPPRAKTTASPPSKKANTNTSPHRNIYALFKPPIGRNQRLLLPPQRIQATHSNEGTSPS